MRDRSPRRTAAAAVLAVLLLLASPWAGATARAQEARGGPPEAALAGLSEGRLLRIRDASGRLFIGDYAGLTDDGLVLAPPAGSQAGRANAVAAERAVALARVRLVEGRGRSTGRGAWIGGIAGAVGGGALGALFHDLCESDCGTRMESALQVGAFFGVGGALLGGIVGAAIPRWHRIWP